MAWNRPVASGKTKDGHQSLRKTWCLAGIAFLGMVLAGMLIWRFELQTEKATAEAGKSREQHSDLVVSHLPALPDKTAHGSATKVLDKPSVASSKTIATNTAAFSYSVRDAIRLAEERGVRRIFKHQCDVWLSQFVQPGVRVPPIPPSSVSRQEILDALLDPIVVSESDTASERSIKESVIEMRKEAVEWINAGGDFDEYLRELQRRQDREADLAEDAKHMMMECLRESSAPEDAALAWRMFNQKLKREGIRPITLPAAIRIKLARVGVTSLEE